MFTVSSLPTLCNGFMILMDSFRIILFMYESLFSTCIECPFEDFV